jgi:hypothetical protein
LLIGKVIVFTIGISATCQADKTGLSENVLLGDELDMQDLPQSARRTEGR